MPDLIPVLTLIDTVQMQGGAERLAVELTTRLDRDRFMPMLCLTRWAPEWREPLDDEPLEALRAAGVPLFYLKRRGKADLRAWRPLLATLRARRVQVVHSHKIGSNVWGALLGPIARVPAVVAHEHTWSYEGQMVRRMLDRHLVARGADAIVAVSRADRRRMIEIEGIPAERIHYIPNGVATADDAGAPADVRRIREALGVPVDAPLVGAVGSLRPQKAFEVLIDAAVLLRARHPGIRVVIAGGGDEQPTLQAHIDRVGAGDVVSLLGARDDVRELLQAFDVAVNCSDFEGQPLSVLEEMDASLPIVATRVGGVPDLIDDGVHGRLVPPRDPAALAGAVDAMLADRDAARAMGARARIRRREEFDIAHTVRRTEALYETLLGARRATRSNAGPRASSNHSSFE